MGKMHLQEAVTLALQVSRSKVSRKVDLQNVPPQRERGRGGRRWAPLIESQYVCWCLWKEGSRTQTERHSDLGSAFSSATHQSGDQVIDAFIPDCGMGKVTSTVTITARKNRVPWPTSLRGQETDQEVDIIKIIHRNLEKGIGEGQPA